METTIVASDHITISVTLIWTVIGSLVTAIGVLATVVGFLYNKSREDSKAFTHTLISQTSQLVNVTVENSASNHELATSNQMLTRAVQELPEKIMMMIRK